MKIEDTPERWRLTQTNTLLMLGVLAYMIGAVALVLAADVFSLRCDKQQDRCEFESHSLWAGYEGRARLSQVDYLVDTESVTRTGRSRVATRARLRFVMRDHRSIELEERSRSALVSDGVCEAFIAFRRSNEREFSRIALHFGDVGLFAPLVMSIGAVLVLVGRRRRIEFDFVQRRFVVRVSGVRIGAFSLDGPLADIESIELVERGAQLGVWLKTRSNRRARLDFERVGPMLQSLVARLGIPVVAQTSSVIEASPDRRSIGPALLATALVLAPLALLAAWPAIERAL